MRLKFRIVLHRRSARRALDTRVRGVERRGGGHLEARTETREEEGKREGRQEEREGMAPRVDQGGMGR